MTNNVTLKYRVTELEKDVTDLKGDIKLILTNHLPHIENEITKLVTRVNTATAINVGAVIVGVLIAKYL